MALKSAPFQIPAACATPTDRARYCRNRAAELVRKASKLTDENEKFELLNVAERWMTLAFQHRREANLQKPD